MAEKGMKGPEDAVVATMELKKVHLCSVFLMPRAPSCTYGAVWHPTAFSAQYPLERRYGRQLQVTPAGPYEGQHGSQAL